MKGRVRARSIQRTVVTLEQSFLSLGTIDILDGIIVSGCPVRCRICSDLPTALSHSKVSGGTALGQ